MIIDLLAIDHAVDHAGDIAGPHEEGL